MRPIMTRKLRDFKPVGTDPVATLFNVEMWNKIACGSGESPTLVRPAPLEYCYLSRLAQFIAKKLLYGLLVLLGVISTIFFLFNVLPGDPAEIILGQRASREAIEAVHK